jgi:hypothetical protein
MALPLQLLAYLVGAFVLVYLFAPLFSSLRSIGGPFLARFTDLWYVGKLVNGTVEHDWIRLHEKHGEAFLGRYYLNIC